MQMGEPKKPDISYAKPRLATLALLLLAAFLLGAAIAMVFSHVSAKQAQQQLEDLAKTVQMANDAPTVPEGIKASLGFPAVLAAAVFLLGVLASQGWRGAALAALAAACLHLALSYALHSDLHWSNAAQYACFLLVLAMGSRLARGSAPSIHVLCVSAGWILFALLWPTLTTTVTLTHAAGWKSFIFALSNIESMLQLLAITAPFAIAWMIATKPLPAKKAS